MDLSPSLCDNCGKRPATIFISRTIGSIPYHKNLCEFCAGEQTEGEAWLGVMAQKFGLPVDASLDEIMQSLAAHLPDAPGEMSLSASDEEVPGMIVEANLQFIAEFPSDEDEADELDESELHESESEAASDDELSIEALKAHWQIEPEAPVNGKSTPLDIHAERCPKCGTTWDRLREDGRAGCARCYEAFHERLTEVVGRLQREPQHVGKSPRAAIKRRRRLEHLRARRDHRLEMLNRRLQQAVSEENYEDAARLRDQIKMVASTIVSDE